MTDPRSIEPVMDALRPGWRQRRDKRKSPWNLVCLALGWSAAYGYFRFFWRLAVGLNIRIYPEHAALAGHIFKYIDKTSSPSGLLMEIPLFFPAMICGLITGNLITWLIPPARRAMDCETAGDREMSFGGANAGLIKYGGVVSAVCFILSAIGILTFRP